MRERREGLFARFGAPSVTDFLACLVAVAAILLVFVNALGLQKAPNVSRLSPSAMQKPVPPSVPAAAPLPQPRPSGNTRSQTDLMRDVQQELASRGYYDGAVDGAAGPRISQAIRDFETAQRLRVTGEASETLLGQIRKTAAKADVKPGAKAEAKSDITGSIGPSATPAGNPKILSVQRLLARYGYGPVQMSGAADQATHEAIARFERDRQMPQTGEVSERLLRELAAYSGGTLD